jgi:hypothetical protein
MLFDGSWLGVQLQRPGDGVSAIRDKDKTRQDKTRQDISMDVDADPEPNPGGELVLGAYCASAGIKVGVKIQPVEGHARNEV